MSLWRRTLEMFGYGTESKAVVEEAIHRQRAVGEKADRMNRVLDRYLESPDPFKALAVDVFERGQESRLHLGPPQ